MTVDSRMEAAAKAMERNHRALPDDVQNYWHAQARIALSAAADAVEGDRPEWDGQRLAAALRWIVEVAATEEQYKNVARAALAAGAPKAQGSGGGVEPSREDRPPASNLRENEDGTLTATGPVRWELEAMHSYARASDRNFADLRAAEARVVELEGALESAIYLAEDKWPVEARTLRARFLAAADEGDR